MMMMIMMTRAYTHIDYSGDEEQDQNCNVQEYDATKKDQHVSTYGFLHTQTHTYFTFIQKKKKKKKRLVASSTFTLTLALV